MANFEEQLNDLLEGLVLSNAQLTQRQSALI